MGNGSVSAPLPTLFHAAQRVHHEGGDELQSSGVFMLSVACAAAVLSCGNNVKHSFFLFLCITLRF